MSERPKPSSIARDVFGFLRFVLRRWSEDRCPQVAGSLTFTTLLALVPVFTIVVAMLSSSPYFETVTVRLKIFLLLNLMPEIAGKIITVYMEQFAAAAKRLTAMSLGVLLVSTFAMLFTVDRALNRIWRVRYARPLWLSLSGYILLLSVGPLLIVASVSVTTYLFTLSMGLDAIAGDAQPLLLRAVPVLMTGITFFLVYRIVPHRRVPWRHALAGGVLAAIAFEAMKEAFAAYLGAVPMYDLVYGAFAAIPVFLAWLYFSWLAVLLGAEFTACAGFWRGRLWRGANSPAVRLRNSLDVGRCLLPAPGAPLDFERIRSKVEMPDEVLEDTLARLENRGVVKRVRSGYALARPPGEIALAEFHAAAVGERGGLDPRQWSGISPELLRAASELEELLKRPINEVLAAPDDQDESGRREVE